MKGQSSTDGVAIRAENVRKAYGSLLAVAGIGFQVDSGECFGFLGPNGAGKSTMMKMLYRTALLDGGSLRVLGHDVGNGHNDRDIKKRLGVVPQETNLDESLTVRENLEVFGRFYRISGPELEHRVEGLLERVGLGERAGSMVPELSGGMKRRLLIARGLLGEPELLILDEPTTGLDPKARQMLWSLLEDLSRRAMTLILTTHYMDEAEKLCDRLVFMDSGKIVAEGRPDSLIRERVSRFVVEFKDLSDAEIVAMDERVAAVCDGTRRYGQRYLAFSDHAERVVDVARGIVPDATALLRRSNLEDVFLEITGHALEDQ